MKLHEVRAHNRRGTQWGVQRHLRGDPDPRDILLRADQRAEREVGEQSNYALRVWEQDPSAWPSDLDAAAAELAEQTSPGPLQDRVRRRLRAELERRYAAVPEG